MIKAEVLVPLLNANEPEARLVAVHVKDGQKVKKDALLFTLETTKAAADVEAPAAGYVRILSAEGDILAVGDRLAVITGTADEPLALPSSAGREEPADLPAELRITKPARSLAESLGIDLSTLPTGRLVTEEVVRGISAQAGLTALPVQMDDVEHAILIYGGGGHAKSVMDMVLQMQAFQIAGILDDNIPAGVNILGIPVLGSRQVLPGLVKQGIHLAANGVGGIIDINIRVQIFDLLESYGFSFPALHHPRATIETSATVGAGAQVFANAYVGSSAVLHPRCMINTNAVVSHDCEIGSYSHIAPGALLAGHVRVGERTLVGMGVTTAIGVKIGSAVRIGNGAIIYADVLDKTIIPAGVVFGKK